MTNKRKKFIVENFGEETARALFEHEAEAIRKRNKILGLKEGERTATRRYVFDFPEDINFSKDDEEKVVYILRTLGERRYKQNFDIHSTDREIKDFEGIWRWASLVYPNHYIGYTDNITIDNNAAQKPSASLTIYFVRGRKEISSSTKRKALDELASKLFESLTQDIRDAKGAPLYQLRFTRNKN